MGMPIACEYGKDCFISSLFSYEETQEESPEKLIRDYKCGRLTQAGEKSTRFALRNIQQIDEGVDVIAVDKGTVEAVHDGEKDIGASKANKTKIPTTNNNCGNGVIIRHGRGFLTQYCHLQQGSLAVEVGQEVKKGDPLGKVGSSGTVSYPHLEFIVKRDNTAIDPFTGEGITSCTQKKDFISLWDFKTDAMLSYVPTLLINASFTANIPNAEGVNNGRFITSNLTNDEDRIVFWVNLMGLQKDDILEISITSPRGKTIALREKAFSRYEPFYFHYVGKRKSGAAWERGKYIGNVSLSRLKEDTAEQQIKDKNSKTTKDNLGRTTKVSKNPGKKNGAEKLELPEELPASNAEEHPNIEKTTDEKSAPIDFEEELLESAVPGKAPLPDDRFMVIDSNVELIVE